MADTTYRFSHRSREAHPARPPPPGTLNLSGGLAFGPTMPDISREAVIAARDYRTESMQYSSVLGLDDLRDEIRNYVAADGIACGRDEVLVVNGAKHAIDLACRVFLDRGDQVVVTHPMYHTALAIFRTHEASFLPIPQDDEGMQVDELEARLVAAEADAQPLPKLLYDVPDFHNPTGVTLSAERRRRLVALAGRFGFVILEDDPYRRIRFEGEPVPTIKSFDDAGVVISIGTSSKIVAPGLRLGWMIAAPALVVRLAEQKADGGTSAFTQRILVELLRGNRVAGHIDELKPVMKAHRDCMLAALSRHLPEIVVKRPAGGYFLWLQLPSTADPDAVVAAALDRGVGVYSGNACFPVAATGRFLRVCYSFASPEQIEDGIRRLALAYRSVVPRSRG